MCLQALAKMKVRWIHIPSHVRRILLSAIIREDPHGNYAFPTAFSRDEESDGDNYGDNYDSDGEGKGDGRERPLTQDRSQAIAIIVHSLGKLNCQWSELELDFYSVLTR